MNFHKLTKLVECWIKWGLDPEFIAVLIKSELEAIQ